MASLSLNDRGDQSKTQSHRSPITRSAKQSRLPRLKPKKPDQTIKTVPHSNITISFIN